MEDLRNKNNEKTEKSNKNFRFNGRDITVFSDHLQNWAKKKKKPIKYVISIILISCLIFFPYETGSFFGNIVYNFYKGFIQFF